MSRTQWPRKKMLQIHLEKKQKRTQKNLQLLPLRSKEVWILNTSSSLGGYYFSKCETAIRDVVITIHDHATYLSMQFSAQAMLKQSCSFQE